MAVFAIMIAAVRIAWVSDDALITLRTALNITNGWGAGYNATEAVQGYTHPVWFLIWVGICATTHQWFLGILIVSILFTGLAVGLILWRAVSISRIILATGILLFSNAFLEYSTSGLENPLACTGVALVGVLALTASPAPRWSWGYGLGWPAPQLY